MRNPESRAVSTGSAEPSAAGHEKAPYRLFISYRRGDNTDFVEHIHSWFAWRFANVFMDFASIPGGADYGKTIRDEIAKCDAMLVVIGPTWMDRIREDPYNDDDWVRTGGRDWIELRWNR